MESMKAEISGFIWTPGDCQSLRWEYIHRYSLVGDRVPCTILATILCEHFWNGKTLFLMIWDVPKLKYCPTTLSWRLLWSHATLLVWFLSHQVKLPHGRIIPLSYGFPLCWIRLWHYLDHPSSLALKNVRWHPAAILDVHKNVVYGLVIPHCRVILDF